MTRPTMWIKSALVLAMGMLGVFCYGPDTNTTLTTKNKDAEPEVVFFDDFTGPALNRSRWNVRITGWTVNNEQQAYVDSSATLYISQGSESAGASNGMLVIQAWYSPGFVTPEGNTFDFISGRMDTQGKMEFTYGTAAARMKLPPGPGYWPAFWALGTGQWPNTGEIGIMEYVGDTTWSSVALHGPGYSGDTPLVKRANYPDGTDATDWHVYSVDWSPDSFLFKVDDAVIYRVTRPKVEQYGPWAFDNAKYLILNLALGGNYPFGVNGVESPYYGIPESTVQSIKANLGKVVVDWIRVTKSP